MMKLKNKDIGLAENPEQKTPIDTSEKRSELPDDSGDKKYKCELPDDSGENQKTLEKGMEKAEEKILSNLEQQIDLPEKNSPIKNKEDGLARENEVKKELEEKYPSPPHTNISEVYLRDKDGNIVKDPETGEARRIDFVVVKDGTVVDSVEVTSKTADKTEQSAKEQRIRENGGNYIKMPDGSLAEIPANVTTRIERRA